MNNKQNEKYMDVAMVMQTCCKPIGQYWKEPH